MKVSPRTSQTRLALSTTSIQDHGTADKRFSFSVIHSYLSKRNYPAHFTKEDKHALRKRAKHFGCTDDRKLYYILLNEILTLRRLVVEDHEQRK